ncbi:hypothetical protein Tco_1379231 [Tanacetum coccineum]
MGLTDDILNRSKIARDLDDMNKKDSIDLAQKAKVKWAIEGDENSKFFHGIVNKKRRYLAIKGILKDGEWIDNPTRVKAEFYHHFSNRFSQPDWTRSFIQEPPEGVLKRLESIRNSFHLGADFGVERKLLGSGFGFVLFSRWSGALQIPSLLDYTAWEAWIAGLRLKKLQKLVLEASFSSLWWHIWVFRNVIMFT